MTVGTGAGAAREGGVFGLGGEQITDAENVAIGEIEEALGIS